MNTPLKISVVEPSGGLYGSEFALLDILEQLNPAEFQVEVILPRNSPFAERLQKCNITQQALLWPKSHTQPRWKKILSYLQLARHWSRTKPNLIYVNQGGILRPVVAIAKRLHIPILCQVQTLEDARWLSSLKSLHTHVSTFICNSQYIAEQCLVPKDRLTTLYYGYKPKGLSPATRATAPGTNLFQIGLLGRICEGKGHFFIAEVARLLKASGSRQFHFRFIGSPDNPAEGQRLEALIKKHGLEEWIERRGYQQNIAAEFAQLHLLAIPSLAEPFGRIFCETAEARVPALLADSGGLGELSRRFDAGIRFAPGNAADFVGQLQWVVANYETVQNEFEQAGQHMLAALDLDAYVSVMKELLIQTATGRPVSINWLGTPSQK